MNNVFRSFHATGALALLSALFFTTVTPAQECSAVSVLLQTQAQVDAFQETYGPCDRLGTIQVEGADITNLDGLSDIVELGWSLRLLANPRLTDLAGLTGLERISKDLFIEDNPALVDLTGLESLERVGEVAAIGRNARLRSLDGLKGLQSTGATLALYDNPSLVQVDALSSLRFVGDGSRGGQGWLHIDNNDALLNLDGLANVETVGNMNTLGGLVITDNDALVGVDNFPVLREVWTDMFISGNARLESISGFDALERVFGIGIGRNPVLVSVQGPGKLTNTMALGLQENPKLESLTGFDALHTLHSELVITENVALPSLHGLESLSEVGEDVTVTGNPELSDCLALVTLLDREDDAAPGPSETGIPDVGGETTVARNAYGCSSVSEILASQPLEQINVGVNDAWYLPETDGQGFAIIAFPDKGLLWLAWYTYDLARPAPDVEALLGDPGHRWLTAVGPYDGNRAVLDIVHTQGGEFDAPIPVPESWLDGTIELVFDSCLEASVSYDLPTQQRAGFVPIRRVATDNAAWCAALDELDES